VRACIGSVALGYPILDLVVNAAGTTAAALTGLYSAYHNTIERWAVVRVDLERLSVLSAEEIPGRDRPDVDLGELVPRPHATPAEPAAEAAARRFVGTYNPELWRDSGQDEQCRRISGGRIVSATWDGVLRVWDADALERLVALDEEDLEARTALEAERSHWTAFRRTPPLGESRQALDVAVRDPFLDLVRSLADPGRGSTVARWASPVPLALQQFDNIVWSPALEVRACLAGTGIAVETANGKAYMLDVYRGGTRVDLQELVASR
jgi:hypothetical protein